MQFHATTACPVVAAVKNDIFCNSQGTVATIVRCGGQVQKHSCRIFSGFSVTKIIHIGLFLTELFKKIKRLPLFEDTVYMLCIYDAA